MAQVRGWIDNYHKVKDHLEKISDINRELLRRQRAEQRKHKLRIPGQPEHDSGLKPNTIPG